MRFLLATLLTATLSFIAGLYLPWWSIAVVAFLVALLIRQGLGMAYLSAFIAIYFLWGGLAYFVHVRNQGLFTGRIAQLFKLDNAVYLIAITAFIGAIVAGFAAMSGSSLLRAERGLVK